MNAEGLPRPLSGSFRRIAMRYARLCALLLGAFLLAALRGFASEEEMLTISRQVLLPDGKPAAGVRVLIRTQADDNCLLQEIETKTGPDGMVRAVVRYHPPEMPFSPFGPVSNGYLMVDAPGCALAFGKLFGGTPGGGAMRPGMMPPPPAMIPGGAPPTRAGGSPVVGGGAPLQLVPAYQNTGVVVTGENKQPVAGATVFPVALVKSVPVNFLWAGFMTKELVTTTGPDGTFTLRGVTAESLGGMGPPYMAGTVPAGLVAYATVGERTLVGENDRFVYSPQPRGGPVEIALQPTVTLEGRVMNGRTNKPVAGIRVHLEGSSTWINCLPAVITDAEGDYQFTAVLPGPRVYALARDANYTIGWVLATGRGRGDAAGSIAAPAIAIRPMGPPITIRVVDEITGKPPTSILELAAELEEGMFDDDLGWIGSQRITVPVKPDGTATVTMPLGETNVNVWGEGYHGGSTIEVPAADNKAIVPVERTHGLLMHFTTTNPQGVNRCVVTVRDGNGNKLPIMSSNVITNAEGYFFYDLEKQPTGPFQVQVTRPGGPEALPWTPGSTDTWPNIIQIK